MSMSIPGVAVYAGFALLQELPLAQIRPYSDTPRLESAQRVAPAWFAAAAEDHADLLATAPELLASWESGGVAPDSDLVAMYAPEFREKFEAPRQVEQSARSPVPPTGADTPRTSVQMRLMSELDDLE